MCCGNQMVIAIRDFAPKGVRSERVMFLDEDLFEHVIVDFRLDSNIDPASRRSVDDDLLAERSWACNAIGRSIGKWRTERLQDPGGQTSKNSRSFGRVQYFVLH